MPQIYFSVNEFNCFLGLNNNNYVLVNENHSKRIVNRLEEATQLVSVIVVVVVPSGFVLF